MSVFLSASISPSSGAQEPVRPTALTLSIGMVPPPFPNVESPTTEDTPSSSDSLPPPPEPEPGDKSLVTPRCDPSFLSIPPLTFLAIHQTDPARSVRQWILPPGSKSPLQQAEA